MGKIKNFILSTIYYFVIVSAGILLSDLIASFVEWNLSFSITKEIFTNWVLIRMLALVVAVIAFIHPMDGGFDEQ